MVPECRLHAHRLSPLSDLAAVEPKLICTDLTRGVFRGCPLVFGNQNSPISSGASPVSGSRRGATESPGRPDESAGALLFIMTRIASWIQRTLPNRQGSELGLTAVALE
jgi:hypothetical protein